jgi:hypothetical protein
MHIKKEMPAMQLALRPYATAGVAMVGASMIIVTPVVTVPSLPDVRTRAVELDAVADAYATIANALDPTASTDGLLSFANSLDSILDLFGNPTVNVADTLATDYVGILGIGGSLSDITSLLSGLGLGDITPITTALGTLDTDLNTGLGDITTALGTLDTDLLSELDRIFTSLGTLDTDLGSVLTALGPTGELGTINTSIGTLGTDIDNELTSLFGPSSAIAGDLGNLGGIATDLTSGFGTLDSDLGTITADLATIGSALALAGL